MNRGRNTGMLLMAGAVLQLLLFVYGALRRSYLAVALPMTFAMLALSALTFWLGWTMMSLEDTEDETPIRPAE